jgi:saccharopine dehydrogenase (NAD+, L-glutamate forming)
VPDRAHEIVLLGATGFTGTLTAEYLARNAPPGTRLALAGRSLPKLEALRARLSPLNRAWRELPLLYADVTDAGSMRALAASTRVVITTVGPYLTHGEPLVAACAEAGTDYLDLSGESEFVDLMYLRHHEQAMKCGARIVHCCGFDSLPHDLGAYFTVKQLPERAPISVDAFVQLGLDGLGSASFSAGTLESAITIASRPLQLTRAASARRRREPLPDGRRIRRLRAIPGRARALGAWLLPMPTIDPHVVRRSAVALDRYGPDFSYRQRLAVDRLSTAAAMVGGVAAIFALAQLRPTRKLLMRRITPRTGPSAAQRERRWFRLTFAGEGGGRSVLTEVAGGDPGYDESAKMLAEAALCLAHDELVPAAGQLTAAAAMGDALIRRLSSRGISFSVLEVRPAR